MNKNTEYKIGVLKKQMSSKQAEIDKSILELYDLSLEIQTLKHMYLYTYVEKTEFDKNNKPFVTPGIVIEKTNKYDFIGKYHLAEIHVNIVNKKDQSRTKRFAELTSDWKKM